MRAPNNSRWSLILTLMISCLAVAGLVWAQAQTSTPPPPNAATDPLLKGFEFRSIGPAVMAGRVDDIIISLSIKLHRVGDLT